MTISGRASNDTMELLHVESPLDPMRVELNDERFLRLDEQGGMSVNIAISDRLSATGLTQIEERWIIDYIELEVTGKTNSEE